VLILALNEALFFFQPGLVHYPLPFVSVVDLWQVLS